MIVGELLSLIRDLPLTKEIKFTDVCGNSLFDLYSVEQDEQCIFIVGDENYD